MASTRKSYTGPSNRPLPVIPQEEQEELVPGTEITAPESLDPADSLPPPQEEPIPVPEPRALPDNTEALAALRAREDALTQGANLMRMGEGVNAAFMGREANPNAATQPFNDRIKTERTRFNEDRNLEQVELDKANAADLADPDSPLNKQYRMVIRPILGERFVATMGPAFQRLTKAQIEELMPAVKDRIKLDDTEKAAERQREQDARKFALEEEKTRADIEQGKMDAISRWTDVNRVSTMEAESDDGAQGEISDRMGKREIIKFANDLAKDAPLMENFQRIERLAPGITFGKVPPGLDAQEWERIKSETLRKLGGKRVSDEYIVNLRSTVSDIKQGIRKERYGATLTDSEKADFDRVFDDALRSGWEAQAIALDLFRRQLGSRIKLKSSGLRVTFPEDLDAYLKDSGLTNVLPLFTQGINDPLPTKSPGRAPEPKPAPVAPPAAPTNTVPAPAPSKYKDGDTKEVKQPDGSVTKFTRINGKWVSQ
jgi:hypothetical protein